jgi:hypothetical protein
MMRQRKVGLIGLTLVLMGITFIAQAEKLDDLLVHLSMNEGKGKAVKDGSDNGFDAEIVNGGGKWIAGQFDKGLELTAAEEVQIEDRPEIDGGKEFTIAMWVFQESQQNTGLIQKGTNWPDISYLLQPWSDGQIYFGVNVTASRAITKPGAFSLSKWYHLVGTFDGDMLKVFIDGTLKAEAKAPVKEAPDTGTPLQLANRFAGKVDEFVMYSRALPKEEIRAVFENDFLAVDARGKVATTWGRLKSR